MARMEEEKPNSRKRTVLKDSLDKLATAEGLKFEIRKKLNVAEVGRVWLLL